MKPKPKIIPKQARPKPEKREPRKAIISFRLRDTEVQSLRKDMLRHPSFAVSSLKQFCRKLVVDYIGNALIYVNPIDRQTGTYRMVEITCNMQNAAFLKALYTFLDNNEDNWKKLRAFMLGLGWPERQAKEFRDTLDDYERVQLARNVLRKMIKSL